jgi:hypothetical protein
MSNQFDVKLRSLPNEDLVQGYPGIKATWVSLVVLIIVHKF